MTTAITVDCIPTFEYSPKIIGGSSQSALDLQKIVDSALEHYLEPISLSYREELYNHLALIYNSCSKQNWDGYGASPVSRESFFYAVKFIRDLPAYLPKPDIGADPDGEISFEWHNQKDRMYILSVSGNGSISFAGMYGEGSEIHGTEKINGGIPKEIIRQISRLFSNR